MWFFNDVCEAFGSIIIFSLFVGPLSSVESAQGTMTMSGCSICCSGSDKDVERMRDEEVKIGTLNRYSIYRFQIIISNLSNWNSNLSYILSQQYE